MHLYQEINIHKNVEINTSTHKNESLNMIKRFGYFLPSEKIYDTLQIMPQKLLSVAQLCSHSHEMVSPPTSLTFSDLVQFGFKCFQIGTHNIFSYNTFIHWILRTAKHIFYSTQFCISDVSWELTVLSRGSNSRIPAANRKLRNHVKFPTNCNVSRHLAPHTV